MKAYNITYNDLEQAMRLVNKKYDNNVTWNRSPERTGRAFRFTLRVNDSNGKGREECLIHRMQYYVS